MTNKCLILALAILEHNIYHNSPVYVQATSHGAGAVAGASTPSINDEGQQEAEVESYDEHDDHEQIEMDYDAEAEECILHEYYMPGDYYDYNWHTQDYNIALCQSEDPSAHLFVYPIDDST